MKQEIFVTTRFTEFHHWPEAPTPVAFLRTLHRHIFGVKVTFDVSHPDRQLEFFIMQTHVNAHLAKELMPHIQKNRAMSCEMMAQFIAEHLLRDFAVVSVEVNEDGENGAIFYV